MCASSTRFRGSPEHAGKACGECGITPGQAGSCEDEHGGAGGYPRSIWPARTRRLWGRGQGAAPRTGNSLKCSLIFSNIIIADNRSNAQTCSSTRKTSHFCIFQFFRQKQQQTLPFRLQRKHAPQTMSCGIHSQSPGLLESEGCLRCAAAMFDSFLGSCDKVGMIRRRFACPLCMDDTHKLRTELRFENFFTAQLVSLTVQRGIVPDGTLGQCSVRGALRLWPFLGRSSFFCFGDKEKRNPHQLDSCRASTWKSRMSIRGMELHKASCRSLCVWRL